MLACLSTKPIAANWSNWEENLSSGGLLSPWPAMLDTIWFISVANAALLLDDVVGAEDVVVVDDDEEEEVLVVVAGGVEVVDVEAELLLGWGIPGPATGIPIDE